MEANLRSLVTNMDFLTEGLSLTPGGGGLRRRFISLVKSYDCYSNRDNSCGSNRKLA